MEKPQLSVNVKVAPGAAPAAGYAAAELNGQRASQDSEKTSMAPPAMQATAKGGILPTELGEALPVLAMRLRNEIPFDSIAILAVNGNGLVPCLAFGEECGKLLRLHTQCGEGLLGWVAHTRRSIRNGNPSVDLAPGTVLRSALAAPLEVAGEIVGVIALYQRKSDGFTTDHLNRLESQRDEIATLVHGAVLADGNSSVAAKVTGEKRPATVSPVHA